MNPDTKRIIVTLQEAAAKWQASGSTGHAYAAKMYEAARLCMGIGGKDQLFS